MKKILFVCRNNKFRSKLAEAYFNKINKNPEIKAESAGVFESKEIHPTTIKVTKSLGVDIGGKSRGMSNELVSEQDLVVIVADDVPESIFMPKYTKQLIKLEIKDGIADDEASTLKSAQNVIKSIGELNRKIEIGDIKL